LDVLSLAKPKAGGIQRRAFDSKPRRTGNGGAVKRAGARTAEVRGSNPLSSTKESAQIGVISWFAE
jgi:hypothetical protein